jgi:GNAT superfamily N-acetyltransferase
MQTAPVSIRDESISALEEHARISIAFEVRSVLEVELREGGLGGLVLVERALAAPWRKDYGADDDPTSWPKQFDAARWGLLSAWAGATRVGGVVIAFDTPGVNMLQERRDLAVLWDVRIEPSHRRRGAGALLFHAAEDWARSRGCVRLDVETQNVNVPACRFYARMGCELREIDRFAYPDLPDEVRLLWSKRL